MNTIGIFDDHPSVLSGVTSELERHKDYFLLQFTASEKDPFLQLLKQFRPEILVLDILSDNVSGPELFEYVNEHFTATKVICYSSLASPILVENLLSLGVLGYVNKRQPTGDLIDALFKIADGDISLPPDYLFLTSRYKTTRPALLTARETEIVTLVGAGLTTSEISEKLFLSPNTIENHRKRIFTKLNVKNVASMIVESIRLGYLK